MAVTGTEGLVLLVARVLVGGVIAFMGLNHFMQSDAMAGYAEAKGLPAPTVMVYASGLVLVLGGLGIALGVFPAVAAVAIAGFLVVAALTVHDFWAVPDEQAQDEMTHFLKNLAMAGAVLAFAAVGTQEWAYSVGLGLL